MQEKTRHAAGALGKAVLYGGAAALGLAILTSTVIPSPRKEIFDTLL